MILAQTSVIAAMGAGFAYHLRYEVTGFKLIVEYQNNQPKFFSSNKPTLTKEMRTAISGCNGGDRILIEGIRTVEHRYKFKANLNPIIITVKGKHYPSKIKYDFARFIYTKDSIITSHYSSDIIQRLSNMENGQAYLYSGTINAMTTIRIVLKNLTKSEYQYNEKGQLTSERHQIDSTRFSYIKYINEQKIVQSFINTDLVLYANETFADCRDQSTFYNMLHEADTTCMLIDIMLLELYTVYLEDNLSAVNTSTSFYSNEQIKSTGLLLRSKGQEKPDSLFCGTGINYYTFNDHSVMHGTWYFYRQDGTVLETREYNIGVLVE